MSNPFLSAYNTPFEVPPFHLIRNEHYMPALKQAITEAREEIENIAGSTDPATFENTIEALEKSGALMERVTSVLFNLNSAETNDELQGAAREASPLLSEFDNEVKQNTRLWERIKTGFRKP